MTACPPCGGDFRADGVGVIAAIGEERLDAIADHPEKWREAMNIMGLAGCHDEAERPTFAVATGVELGREAAARAAEPLRLLSPFFMSTAQWWARTTVESIMSADRSRPAISARLSNMASNTPPSTQRRYRRKTLFHLPYSSGSWRHCAPVRAIHSIPSK